MILLGTRLIMEDTYYPDYLKAWNIHAVTPDGNERVIIQTIQTHIATGNPVQDEQRAWCAGLLEKYRTQADAALLACTELPLIFETIAEPALALVNPARVQCDRAVEFMLA